MAEILAAFAAPHAVQAAYAALSFAWQQYQIVNGNKERCKVLLQRCQSLLIAVGDQIRHNGIPESMMDNIHILEKFALRCSSKPYLIHCPPVSVSQLKISWSSWQAIRLRGDFCIRIRRMETLKQLKLSCWMRSPSSTFVHCHCPSFQLAFNILLDLCTCRQYASPT